VTTRIASAAGAGADVKFFLPFSKVEEKGDGSVYVESIATAEVKDHHGEIVLHEGSVAAFKEWTEWADKATGGESIGNIREMHETIGAGKAVKWTVDEAAKSNSLGLLVIDSEAAKKTKARVYAGLSIGGDQVKREIREINGEKIPVITSYRLTEVSLVDKPACPVATFTMVKRLDTKESVMQKATPQLAAGEEIVKTIEADGTPVVWLIRKAGDKGIPRAELAKDVSTSADAALSAVKQFMVDVLGMPGGTDIWTLDDAMSALRYMWFAATSAQAKESMGGIEMFAKPTGAVIVSMAGSPSVGNDFMGNLRKLVEKGTYAHHAKLEEACKKFLLDNKCEPADCEILYDKPWSDPLSFVIRKRTELKKSETPADPPVEEKPVEEEKVDPDKAPEPVAAVPPVVPEPEKTAAVDLGPVLEAIAKLATILEPVVKAIQEGSLAKAAGSQDLTQLEADVATIKKAIESLPAAPAGRAVTKTLGAGSQSVPSVETADTIEKAISMIETELHLDPALRQQLRIKAAAAAIRQT